MPCGPPRDPSLFATSSLTNSDPNSGRYSTSPRLRKSTSRPFLVIVPEERPTFRQLSDHTQQRLTIRPTPKNTSGRLVQSRGNGAGPTRAVHPCSETVHDDHQALSLTSSIINGARGSGYAFLPPVVAHSRSVGVVVVVIVLDSAVPLLDFGQTASDVAQRTLWCGWASRQDYMKNPPPT
jgi:hypothetical protein